MYKIIVPVMHAQYAAFPVSNRGYTTDQTYAVNDVLKSIYPVTFLSSSKLKNSK